MLAISATDEWRAAHPGATIGLLALSIVMAFAITGAVKREHAERVHVLGLYWHFVDVVWVVVFTVVYIIGR